MKQRRLPGRLARATDLNDDQARELARIRKVIVHIDGGLHATEVAGPQHTMMLAYKLLSAKNDPEIDAILDNVILVLWPTLNPDGQDMVVHWYRQNLGTKYEVSPLPWLYQEYVGHDNNRDGYMMNMKEEQVVTKARAGLQPGDLLLPASDGAVSGAHLDSAVLRSDFRQHQPLCAQLAQRGGHQHGSVSGCSTRCRAPFRNRGSTTGMRVSRTGRGVPQ